MTDFTENMSIADDDDGTFLSINNGAPASLDATRGYVHSLAANYGLDPVSGLWLPLCVDGDGKLCVNSTITSEKYDSRWYNTNSTQTINSTDTTVWDNDFTGQLLYISMHFNRDDVEFILELDGTEVFREELERLENDGSGGYDLEDGDGGLGNFPLYTRSSGETLMFNHLADPIDVASNVTIKSRRTNGGTASLYSILVAYKEVRT